MALGLDNFHVRHKDLAAQSHKALDLVRSMHHKDLVAQGHKVFARLLAVQRMDLGAQGTAFGLARSMHHMDMRQLALDYMVRLDQDKAVVHIHHLEMALEQLWGLDHTLADLDNRWVLGPMAVVHQMRQAEGTDSIPSQKARMLKFDLDRMP
jgi:hypothetical protein